MKQLLLLAALPGAFLAQALEGTCQGALTPNPNLEIRMVFRTKDDSAHQGMLYNLAAGRQFNLGAIALQGNTKLEFEITNPLPLPLKRPEQSCGPHHLRICPLPEPGRDCRVGPKPSGMTLPPGCPREATRAMPRSGRCYRI
jgi:hypothetical protein